MWLRLVKEPFDSPGYIFELKHDGFRAIAYIKVFKSLRASLASNSLAKNAILDGEIIVLDSNGVSQFNSLLPRKGENMRTIKNKNYSQAEGRHELLTSRRR